MATAQPLTRLASSDESRVLAGQWRGLTRAATAVALVTSPVVFVYLHTQVGWSIGWSIVATFVAVIAFRGVVDIGMRKVIPWPSLFGTDEERAKEEDIMNRRRAWYWTKRFRLAMFIVGLITIAYLFQVLTGHSGITWWGTAASIGHGIKKLVGSGTFWTQGIIFPVFFLFNFLILMGPMMLMGITQMQSFEPGDADWGVRLGDVRGQAEAKEEVRRVVNLWQSGEAFEKAGGKRERGLLFLGAPGTGKTMLSKAIATGFNSPFLSMPGSGFAQTFIGMDVIIVRYMAAKARRLARKWGGQCIVFIDEIDAVGRRRSALGGGETGAFATAGIDNFEDHCFFGPDGALTPTGDLVLETRAWREKLFAQRHAPRAGSPNWLQRMGLIVNQAFPGGMMGGGMGSLGLNQLLVVMDGIDNPPFFKRFFTNRLNSFLDACYVVPARVGKVKLRLPPPRPRGDQIYFIGATNVPMDALDPALTRPGRMGRHVWFRTPTKQDRLDVFDLYINKVAHEADLDRPERRDELARITMGYSPAMIEQVCSMALTYAHHEARPEFNWYDLVEAMTTVESGTAINIEYVPEETRSVAIHEAGHAVAAHVYMKGAESTRLSIRRRGAALGHHMALEKEERFSSWQSEEMGRLIWALGATAAERVFYGENSTGVGGDIQSGTARAAWMVGACGMAPQTVKLNGGFKTPEEEEEARKKIRERFARIGSQIMNSTGGGPFSHDPIAGALGDRAKREMATQLLGQAYVAAYNLIAHNKDKVEKVADEVIARKELYGDELIDLLERQQFEVPEVDLTKEEAWPTA